MKKVLVVGSGGREYALAWKLGQSPQVGQVIVAPGNDGMPSSWTRWPLLIDGSGHLLAYEKCAKQAREAHVDLVVIGPDQALANGITDVFEAHGLLVMGPSQLAAKIESSKAFSKEIMQAAGVPTARHFVASSMGEARELLDSLPWPSAAGTGCGWVVKADGLALGKGVWVCRTRQEAFSALVTLSQLLPKNSSFVIEEEVLGEELSWMAFCDGKSCALLEPARDYKRLNDGNAGPNTGGMGAVSPVPGVPHGAYAAVRARVFEPVLREMAKRGTPFRGILYAGLMVEPGFERYWVLEFNARFGDPETQVLLPRLEDDFYLWCEATAKGDLAGHLSNGDPRFSKRNAVFVVAASRGYPESPSIGTEVSLCGSERSADRVFWAGVKRDASGRLLTSGGRVAGALGLGDSAEAARLNAYEGIKSIRFEGVVYRKDIGVPK